MDNIWMNWLKPKYRDSEDFDLEFLDKETDDWWTEDDQIERERDLRDALEDNDADDLKDLNI